MHIFTKFVFWYFSFPYMKINLIIFYKDYNCVVFWLVVIKADYVCKGFVPIGGCTAWGNILTFFYSRFKENDKKFRMVMAMSATWIRPQYLLSTSFQNIENNSLIISFVAAYFYYTNTYCKELTKVNRSLDIKQPLSHCWSEL